MPLLNRNFVTRFIFILFFIYLILLYYEGGYIHQFQKPLMMAPMLNVTYWAFLLLQIPQFFINSFWAGYVADIALFTLCVVIIFKPQNFHLIILYNILLWINFMSFCLVFSYQPHAIAMLLVGIPSMLKTDKNFSLVFWGIRLWACFLYFQVGFMKIIKGGVFFSNQMANATKSTILLNLHHSSGTEGIRQKVQYMLIEHVDIAQLLYVGASTMQICFIVGLFTRRYDLILLILFLLFHFTLFFMLNMELFMINQFFFVCCFLPWHKISDFFENTFNKRKKNSFLKEFAN